LATGISIFRFVIRKQHKVVYYHKKTAGDSGSTSSVLELEKRQGRCCILNIKLFLTPVEAISKKQHFLCELKEYKEHFILWFKARRQN